MTESDLGADTYLLALAHLAWKASFVWPVKNVDIITADTKWTKTQNQLKLIQPWCRA
jgi:hypothetical protein